MGGSFGKDGFSSPRMSAFGHRLPPADIPGLYIGPFRIGEPWFTDPRLWKENCLKETVGGFRSCFSRSRDIEQCVPATPLTKFRIGSVSKPLTAAGVAVLVEQKKLDLDVESLKLQFPRSVRKL